MIEYNAGAELYICNIQARIVDEDYGFIYIGATDTVYFMYPSDIQAKEGKTPTQQYYEGAFTCLGFWAGHPARLNRKDKDKDIERFNCILAALYLCNRFGITGQQYGMSPQAERIVKYLDRLQL